jgi:type I restriction enzyme S subunit
MKFDWIDCALGDAIVLQRGFDLPAQKRVPGSIPIVSSSGVSGFHSQAGVKAPGVITGRYGTLGQVFFLDQDYWPLNTTLWVKDFKSNSPKYIYYLLQTIDFNSCSDKSTVPGVNRNDLHRIKIKLPNFLEQEKIANLLSTFDDRIKLLRETNESLEAISQTLFNSWFIDFDPVHAKHLGRECDGINADTAALFPSSFESSGTYKIPMGWRLGNLSDIAILQSGYAFKTNDWSLYGHPVVKIGNVKPGLVDLSNCSYVNSATIQGLDRFKLYRGDLLVGMTGYVGETGVIANADPCAYLNQRVGRISPLNNKNDYGYIYCNVRRKIFKDFAAANSRGSAQANISANEILKFPVILPSEGILNAFTDISNLLIGKVLNNYEKIQSLGDVRDGLLTRLISGQIDVSDYEMQLQEIC